MSRLSYICVIFRVALEAEANLANGIIHVDRSVRPVYPWWVEYVLHPELELSGPTELHLSKVEQWLHNDQKDGGHVKGEKIYAYLGGNNMLDSCLNFADLKAIQARGAKMFRRYFAGETVFAWKSIVWDCSGKCLLVPCLHERDDNVVMPWHGLSSDWYTSYTALRLVSQSSGL